MTLFEFEDYKAFALQRVRSLPRQGRGELQRIARALRIHPTRVSQVFRGELHLTLEQACELARHFALNGLETDFLLTLVERDRAGTGALKAALDRRIHELRGRASQLVHRVEPERVLKEEDKAIFYTSWMYSGIRLASSIEGSGTIESIAARLELPREKVRAVADFLLATGLCVERDGRLDLGPQSTHVEASSPLVVRHHANWRIKALQRHDSLSERELAYTGPVSVSARDQARIRETLVGVIERFTQTVTASEPPETLACLNIDWFEF